MTCEEAKKRIYLHGKTMTEDEALVILDALEKQIPKKPKKINSWYECPSCGRSYTIKVRHCEWCSQAIDWSVEE